MANKNKDNKTDEEPTTDPVRKEPAVDKKAVMPLKEFLSDRKLIKKYRRPAIRAFAAQYRTSSARDDWNSLLREFVSKPR